VHPEGNEDLSPMSFANHADSQFQHQQLLAEQIQYQQQVQLLQAQMAAAHMQQQQPREQPMGSFFAPRFQALAAQRVAQQQQQAHQLQLQQAAQLAQAQQLFEMQQQQQILLQQEAEQERVKQQNLQTAPPVFEEDSPEPPHKVLGPTGRPQLAPTFTFGAKPRRESEAAERASVSPPPVVVNRSEGIGGAASTGLAGLAARAHKRTGSELSPAMAQQVSSSFT
jgi:protein SSD1